MSSWEIQYTVPCGNWVIFTVENRTPSQNLAGFFDSKRQSAQVQKTNILIKGTLLLSISQIIIA
jgi:hypothetical protein